MRGDNAVRVLVVSADTTMRRGLWLHLDSEDDVVVAGAVHPDDAVDAAIRSSADVVVVDLDRCTGRPPGDRPRNGRPPNDRPPNDRPEVLDRLAVRVPEAGRVLMTVDASLTRDLHVDGEILVDAGAGIDRLVGAVRSAIGGTRRSHRRRGDD